MMCPMANVMADVSISVMKQPKGSDALVIHVGGEYEQTMSL